jgi:hypothetical protein
MSVNGLSNFDTSLLRARLRCWFEIQTMWQINKTSFNYVKDWMKLCILPTRQSYICQYGKTGPYRLQILQQLKPLNKVKQYDFCCNFLRKLADDDTITNKVVPSVWSDTDGFFLWGFVKDNVYGPRCRQHYTSSRHGSERPMQKVIRKFSTCGKSLNIGLMLLKPLVVLTLNFINEKLLFKKLFQLFF